MKLLDHCDPLVHIFLLIIVLLFASVALNSVRFGFPNKGTAVTMYRFMHYIGCSERRLIGHSFYRRQLSAKELRHLPRKIPPRGTKY
jgi:hypothetical protein